MTLQSEHSARAYPAVAFGRPRLDASHVARELQHRDHRVAVFAHKRLLPENTDSGMPGFDDLLAQLEPLRRKLAIRRIKGEALARDEELVLSILNHLLAEHLPPPTPLPAKVVGAMVEAELLLKKYACG